MTQQSLATGGAYRFNKRVDTPVLATFLYMVYFVRQPLAAAWISLHTK